MTETTNSSDERDLSDTVATHYNKIDAGSVAQRVESRIFYLRNFNNWIKSVLISDAVYMLKKRGKDPRTLKVLDLASGKGGDQLKWKKAGVKHVVFADIAAVSMEHCRSRYQDTVNRRNFERSDRQSDWPLFTAEFHVADCSKLRLRDMYEDRHIAFNIVSCQFSFHYAFESMSKARQMIQNAAENLAPGGLFFGTIPDANELVRRARQASMKKGEGEPANSFGNDVYRVTFEKQITASNLYEGSHFPLFGAKYHFQLEGVVNCPEFLVYFPLLETLAREYGLKLLFRMPFSEFYAKSIQRNDARSLIGRMQALEPYPPHRDVSLMSRRAGAYAVAEEWRKKAEPGPDGRIPVIGTMSQDEWEAVSLYMVFMFEKEEVSEEKELKEKPGDLEKEKRNGDAEEEEDDEVPQKKARCDQAESSP